VYGANAVIEKRSATAVTSANRINLAKNKSHLMGVSPDSENK
jgi:hypothetical protein